MKSKLTLKEYAKLKDISLVTVNNHINKGLVNSIKEKGRRYIIIEDDDIKEVMDSNKPPFIINNLEILYKERIKELKEVNKQLNKQNKQLIKRVCKLENKLEKLNDETKDVYKSFIGEMKLLQQPLQKTKKTKKK